MLIVSAQKAADNLIKVNENYSIPYHNEETGYVVDTWSEISKAYNQDIWWFIKPRDFLGVTVEEAMDGVEFDFEQDQPDEDWFSPEQL